MEENFQQEGISLIDLIKVLLSRIKLLIFVLIVGCVAGGAFGFMRSNNIDYYGTSVEFYVNPKLASGMTIENESQYGVYGAYGRHVMDNIVKLLSSESFAEQLMLEENNLPKKGITTSLDEKIDAALAKQVEAANALQEKEVATEAKLAAIEVRKEAQKYVDETYETLNEAWMLAGNPGEFDLSGYLSGSLLNGKEVYVNQEMRDAYLYWDTYAKDALEKAEEAEQQAIKVETEAIKNAKAKEKEVLAVTEIALEEWRETKNYEPQLQKIKEAVSYSYLEDNADTEDAANLARSFIYVKISVLNDEEFAFDLLQIIKREVPIYVEANMAVPSGYEGTNCQRVTRMDQVALTNADFQRNQTLKFGILVGAAAFVNVCVILILVDVSDKRLRDYEVLTKRFNIPILGVVPTIESLNHEAQKKRNGKTEV
jgi:capsular polysaccharide biosynthesis protein